MASEHYFKGDGRCVWCKAPRQAVEDRRAPRECPERPDELRDDREGANEYTGY